MKSGRLGIPVLLLDVVTIEDETQGLVLSQVSESVFSRLGVFGCNRDTTRPLYRTSHSYDEGEDLHKRFAQWFDEGEVRTITII